MKIFDWISFIIGLLVGMILILVLVWILYYSRAFMFSYCPTTQGFCLKNDYLEIEEALLEGYNVDDILKYKPDTNQLVHIRQAGTNSCAIGPNNVEVVNIPQYCVFKVDNQDKLYRHIYSSDNTIKYQEVNGTNIIYSNYSCDGSNALNSITYEGRPVVKWDLPVENNIEYNFRK